MKTYHLKKIKFSRKKETLEEIIRLIYFDKTNYSLQNEELEKIILLLRKHAKAIRSIGYHQDSTYYIRVILKLDADDSTEEELNFLDSLSF